MEALGGELDVYVSRFKPMKYTLAERDERTLMKLVVHRETDRVVGAHMCVSAALFLSLCFC